MIIALLLLIQVCYAIDLRGVIDRALEYYPSLKALKEESVKFKGKAMTYRSYLNPSTVRLNWGLESILSTSMPASKPFMAYWYCLSLGEFSKFISYMLCSLSKLSSKSSTLWPIR